MTTDHPSIGFAATGQLRSRMVTRLLAEGSTVGVWNRPPATLETLADPGAKNAAGLASLARDHGLLMTWRRGHHLF